jgi:hypothetical protein
VWSGFILEMRNDAHLPQQTYHVEFAPVLGYLAVCHAHYIHTHRLYPPARGDDPHDPTQVGATQKPAEGDLVALSYAVCFGHAQVRESFGHHSGPVVGEPQVERLLSERVVADLRLVDSAAYHAVELDATHRYLLASGRQPQELSRVRPVSGPTGDYLVFFGELVFYGDLELGKGDTVHGDVRFDAFRAVHVSGKLESCRT